jgi:capsular polysaccharide export protein
MPGPTFQGSLGRFWAEAADNPPDPALYESYRIALIAQTQINGNFYRRLDRTVSATGLIWTPDPVGAARSGPIAQVVPFPVKGSSNAGLAARPQARSTI